jgi:hypothetical protein
VITNTITDNGDGGTKTATATSQTAILTVLAAGCTHDWGTAWEKDEKYHWRECIVCKEKNDIGVHTWTAGAVTQQPTATETGIKTFACTVCSQIRTETIPATGTSTPDYDYSITNGNNRTVKVDNESGYTFTINGDHTKLQSVKAGNITLIKDTDYTVESGSTKITITKAGLAKIGIGTKTITVTFEGNNTATMTLTIDKADNGGKGGLSGGAIAGIVISAVAVAGAAGFCIYWFIIRKKKVA